MSEDPYDLQRFPGAQNEIYEQVLRELKEGRKQSHWMWFIFPQIHGLGQSSTSRYYAIKSAGEAKAYLDDPILGERLQECARTILDLNGQSALDIFGSIDAQKLRSCMTLFALVAGDRPVFQHALDRFFGGSRDQATIDLVKGDGGIKK